MQQYKRCSLSFTVFTLISPPAPITSLLVRLFEQHETTWRYDFVKASSFPFALDRWEWLLYWWGTPSGFQDTKGHEPQRKKIKLCACINLRPRLTSSKSIFGKDEKRLKLLTKGTRWEVLNSCFFCVNSCLKNQIKIQFTRFFPLGMWHWFPHVCEWNADRNLRCSVWRP